MSHKYKAFYLNKCIMVTTDEPFYLPITIQKLLEDKSIKNKIIGIVLLPPTSKKRRWINVIKEQMHFGIIYFIYRGIQYILFKFLSILSVKLFGRYFSVESVAKCFKIPVFKIKYINTLHSINLLKILNPELIISIAASQIFSKKIIEMPKYGVINVHNAPLPKYQGLMPSFWVLKNKERKTATTVHYMTEKIDSGEIIVQKEVLIDKAETLHSLIKKTKLVTIEAIIEAIRIIERYDGHPPIFPNKLGEATYYGFPSKIDIYEYKKRGGKLIWRNIY